MEGFRAAQVGFLTNRDLVTERAARDDLIAKLAKWRGPFEGAPAHTNDWGPEKVRPDIVDSAFRYVNDDPLGLRFKIRNANEPEMPIYVVQRAFETLGNDLIRAGLTQLGCPYVFADVNPYGPAGGAGGGFDCSGLCLWCYAQLGVVLPHQAEAIRTDPQVELFRDQRKCEPGDLVPMWFPNDRGIAPGHASHIGLWVAPNRMLDTRRPVTEPVAIRPIEPENLLAFGRVKRVNGRIAA